MKNHVAKAVHLSGWPQTSTTLRDVPILGPIEDSVWQVGVLVVGCVPEVFGASMIGARFYWSFPTKSAVSFSGAVYLDVSRKGVCLGLLMWESASCIRGGVVIVFGK